MDRRLSVILFMVSLMAMFVMPATAEMSSTNYRITTTVMSSGGAPMNSTNFKMKSTLGQPTPIMEQGMDPYSDNYGLLPGFWYTLGAAGGTCPGDFDWDFDVDGADLFEYILDSGGIGLDVIATNFGKVNCP
jgi:hypothetical protein